VQGDVAAGERAEVDHDVVALGRRVPPLGHGRRTSQKAAWKKKRERSAEIRESATQQKMQAMILSAAESLSRLSSDHARARPSLCLSVRTVRADDGDADGLSVLLAAGPVAGAVVVERALVGAVDEEFQAEDARVAGVENAKAVAGRGNGQIRPHLKGHSRRPGRGSGQQKQKKKRRGMDQRGSAIGRALESIAAAELSRRRRRSAAQSARQQRSAAQRS